MGNVILLDLDGVLITTPAWKPDLLHADGYSDFNAEAVACFNKLLFHANAEIWLTSSRRQQKALSEFNQIFSNRNIAAQITGYIPGGTNSQNRLAEINAFLNHEQVRSFLILDDDPGLHDLSAERKKHWVQTSPLIGFNHEKLAEALEKIGSRYIF